jgi:hypothetical protein
VLQANGGDQYVAVKWLDKFAKVRLAKQTTFGSIYGLAYRKVQGEADEVLLKEFANEIGGVSNSKIATAKVVERDKVKITKTVPAEVVKLSLTYMAVLVRPSQSFC